MHTDTFDVVIVGAGTAGCVLANRLSARGDMKVALLEAGPPDRNVWLKIPIGFSRTFRDPSVNWCFDTVPQQNLGGRRVFWPRGKVLGGSSSINGMIHIRGHPADFDGWASAGLEDWSWQKVLPYFRKAEGQLCDMGDVYGSDGPIAISALPVANEITKAFVDASVNSGLPHVSTFNSDTQEGAGNYQINTRRGLRNSAAAAYLRPARARPNLAIFTGAHVSRVALRDGRATGVHCVVGGESRYLRASHSVILAAGVVGSPALLQLSGIGDPDDLRRVGIAVAHASARIGKNLQDHFGTRYIARLSRPITVNDDFRRPWRLVRHALRYAISRSGQLAIGGAEAGAFARSSTKESQPDLQFHFLPLSSERGGWTFHPFSGVTANVCQLRPFSRGTIRVASADPMQAPEIDPCYLADERDGAALVAGLRLARKIFAMSPLAESVIEEYSPGASAQSDGDLLAHVCAHGSTVFHPVGTCAMGASPDAPLDGECRIRGVDGLRVVDASSMPSIVSGNTNAAVLMLAERIADRIIADCR